MKLFSTRQEAAAWADGLLRGEGRGYRTLLVHDAGNLTLVLDDGDGDGETETEEPSL